MEKLGLLVRLEAKTGKEQELAAFIKSALTLAEQENETISWYALRMTPSVFGIFDSFKDEEGRKKHLGGQIAKALMEKAPELLTKAPVMEQVEILAVKQTI